MPCKKRLEDFYRSRNFPFVVLTVFILFLHICILKLFGDDLVYAKTLSQTSLFSFLASLYHTWASRLLILGCDVVLLRLNLLIWKVLDSGMFLLAALSLARLAGPKTTRHENWVLVFFLLCYPFQQMASAGWVTTSLNYLWPIALGLFSLVPLKKFSEGKPFRRAEYFLCPAALILACNQEQAAAVIFGLFFVSPATIFYPKKNIIGFWVWKPALRPRAFCST